MIGTWPEHISLPIRLMVYPILTSQILRYQHFSAFASIFSCDKSAYIEKIPKARRHVTNYKKKVFSSIFHHTIKSANRCTQAQELDGDLSQLL